MYYKLVSLITDDTVCVAKENPDGKFLVVHSNGTTEQSDSIDMTAETNSCQIVNINEENFIALMTSFLFS